MHKIHNETNKIIKNFEDINNIESLREFAVYEDR
jgi:hypothetical protein